MQKPPDQSVIMGKSRNPALNQSLSHGPPLGMNQSMMNSGANIPKTSAEEKAEKKRTAPRVRASGKYGVKNEKEANRKAKPNFARRKESMNEV
jgi:hypothetical protein